MAAACHTFWGSHGCVLGRGHQGPHECDCCECPDGRHTDEPDDDGVRCVAKAPWYGEATRFYGADSEER